MVFHTELECKDCKGKILFNGIGGGSASEIPHYSYCRCVDRESNKDKKLRGNVVFKVYATYSL